MGTLTKIFLMQLSSDSRKVNLEDIPCDVLPMRRLNHID